MSTHESVETVNEAVGESGRWETVSVVPGIGGVVLPVPRELVARTVRDGDDLVVVLADGRELVIEGFFGGGDVLLLARDGATGEVVALGLSPDGGIAGVEPAPRGRLEEMFGAAAADAADRPDAFALATQDASDDGGFGTPGIAAVALGGLLVMAALAGSDDDSGAPAFPSDAETVDDVVGAGVRDVTEDNLGAFNDVVEAVRGQARGALSIDDAQMIADTVNEFGATADGVTYAEAQSTVMFSIPGSGADAAKRVSVTLDDDLNPVESRTFGQDGAMSSRASRDVADGRMTEVDDGYDGTTFEADRLEVHTLDAAGRSVESRSFSLAPAGDDAGGTDVLDENGRLTETQAAGASGTTWIRYQYDGDGMLVRKQFDDGYDGTTFVGDRVETYSYDGDGRRVRAEFDDSDGTAGPDGTADRVEVYRHTVEDVDGTPQVVRMEADTGADGTVDRIESYQYAAGGERTATAFEADGTVLRHSYDEDGTRAESLVDVDYDGTMFDPDRVDAYGAESDDGTTMVSTVTPYSAVEAVTFGLDANGDRTSAIFDGDGTTGPDGTMDRAEAYQLNADGDRTAAWFDDDYSDDGTYERAELYMLDAGGRRTETRFDDDYDGTAFAPDRATFDEDTDGTDEREERYIRSADGQRVDRTEVDEDPDGTFSVDRVERHSYYSNGLRSRTDFDDEYNGTDGTDRYELYQYYGSGQLFRTAFDDDGVAGPADRVETYSYYQGGREDGLLGRTDFDDDNDRSTDRVEVYTYNADGLLARTEVDDDYDGTSFDSDSVEIREYDGEGRLSRLGFDESEAGVAGSPDRDVDGVIDRSEAYRYDGSGRLVETRFDTDGDGDVDRAEFDRDGNGTADWVEHYSYDAQGRVARIIFDRTDVDVDGTADADGANGTVNESEAYTYDAGGRVVETRFDDNYSVLRSEVDRIESYVRNAAGGVTETWFDDDADGLADRIEFDDEADGTVERTEARVYNSRGAVSEIARDADADGTDDEVESRTYDVFDRVRTQTLSYDEDDDGTADRTEVHTYEAGLAGGKMSTAYDDDADGTTDRIETYAYQNGSLAETRFDADADGTVDRTEAYAYEDGAVASTRFDDDADGTVDRTEAYAYEDGERASTRLDSDADGTIDEVRLLVDQVLEPDAATAAEWAGLDSVAMGEVDGSAVAGTLVITDAVLSALAGGEAGYSLLVTGEADDTLQINGGGIARDASADTTQDGNDYEAWRGTDGLILVDADIAVEAPTA